MSGSWPPECDCSLAVIAVLIAVFVLISKDLEFSTLLMDMVMLWLSVMWLFVGNYLLYCGSMVAVSGL